MNGQAGKGDKLRQGADLKAYWENYNNIFRKVKPKNETTQQLPTSASRP